MEFALRYTPDCTGKELALAIWEVLCSLPSDMDSKVIITDHKEGKDYQRIKDEVFEIYPFKVRAKLYQTKHISNRLFDEFGYGYYLLYKIDPSSNIPQEAQESLEEWIEDNRDIVENFFSYKGIEIAKILD